MYSIVSSSYFYPLYLTCVDTSQGNYTSAFANYENKLRPVVTPIQEVVPRSELIPPAVQTSLAGPG